MPYSSTKELPDSVKKLSGKAQSAFKSAFNSALKQGKSEAQAFKIAWSATKKVKKKGDSAMSHIPCPDCDRSFLNGAALTDHAESVHTHGDMRTLVRRAVRTVHGGDCMLVDLSDDWLVYDAWDSEQSSYSLYKQSYSIDEAGTVKLAGEPAEVIRRITYIPAPKIESASATLGSIGIAVAAADPVGRAAKASKAPTDTAASQMTIESSAAVKCPHCDKTFKTPIELKMHTKAKHKGAENKDVKNKTAS